MSDKELLPKCMKISELEPETLPPRSNSTGHNFSGDTRLEKYQRFQVSSLLTRIFLSSDFDPKAKCESHRIMLVVQKRPTTFPASPH